MKPTHEEADELGPTLLPAFPAKAGTQVVGVLPRHGGMICKPLTPAFAGKSGDGDARPHR
jgi:hypothetical protein